MHRIVSAMLFLAASSSVVADFAAGLEAYLRGDYATALREFQPLAKQGDAAAQTALGLMYANGEGVPEDAHQAEYWWRKAAVQGLAEAQFNLGNMYANGEGVPEDDIQAEYWWRKAAEQGFATAQFNLGNRYAKGEGVPEDDRQAVYWYRQAAEQGSARAQSNLGLMYANGRGAPEDDRQAVYWYRQAAEQGNARAQSNLGLMYANGRGIPEDDRQAVFWFRKAAEQGNATAQFNLGLMYAKGKGVPEDDIQAVYWYRQAAEQGHAKAQLNLGVRYDNGEGVSEDDIQAVYWYRQAAEQRDVKAQLNLGLMYAIGKGVSKDDVQAYAWINLAAAQGDEGAKQGRTLIQQRVTPAQSAEAQKLSRELAAWIADGRGEPTPATIFGSPVRPPEPSRDTVRQVQAYLALLGYDPAPVDGLPGRRTTAAVRRFQQDLDMTPTGRISDELLALLKAAAAARQKAPAEPVSSGSGFLVSRDGGVVTNHHVVDGCAKVTVIYAGTSHDAAVRAVDADDDLALLEALPDTGEATTFSESPRASLGEAVTVAGYPLHGLLSKELNVTSGNVSALAGLGDDAKRLQITAPVQPGNSGGPLLDGAGNVVGVVVSKLDAVRAAKADRRHPAERQLRHQGRVGAQLPRHPRRRLPPPPVEREARPGTTRGAGARLHRRGTLLGVGAGALSRCCTMTMSSSPPIRTAPAGSAACAAGWRRRSPANPRSSACPTTSPMGSKRRSSSM